MKLAKTQGERNDAYRAQGRQIAVVLRDPKAIAALDRLTAKHGGVTAAIHAAILAAKT